MDNDLIRKMYISIAWAWAIAMLWCLVLQKPWIGLSITFGMILGTAILSSFDIIVRKALKPGVKNPKKALFLPALIKYPLMGLYVFLMVRWGKIDMIAFCGGALIVNLAMFSKVAGINMMEKRTQSKLDKSETDEER